MLFSCDVLVIYEPINSLCNGFIEMGKLKIRSETSQFRIGGRLLVLSVSFGRIELDASMEIERFGDYTSHVLDGNLIALINCNRHN